MHVAGSIITLGVIMIVIPARSHDIISCSGTAVWGRSWCHQKGAGSLDSSTSARNQSTLTSSRNQSRICGLLGKSIAKLPHGTPIRGKTSIWLPFHFPRLMSNLLHATVRHLQSSSPTSCFWVQSSSHYLRSRVQSGGRGVHLQTQEVVAFGCSWSWATIQGDQSTSVGLGMLLSKLMACSDGALNPKAPLRPFKRLLPCSGLVLEWISMLASSARLVRGSQQKESWLEETMLMRSTRLTVHARLPLS